MRLSKALGVAALSATLAATAVTTADAGGRHNRYHHRDHSSRNLGIGIVTGLVAGSILYNATRPHYSSTYVDDEVCYRGPKQCRSHWTCWENKWGNEVCQKEVSCSRPLICE
jgi:hypothetical protein